MRTAQQFYDMIVSHLRQQNARSVLDDLYGANPCAYRGLNNMKCAVGIIIPDEIYTRSMESKTVSQLIRNNGIGYDIPEELLLELDQHRKLLSTLQSIHDAEPVCVWEEHFEILAENLDLQYTP